ncbi:MAG: cytochrome c class I [Rhodospirillales bacterium CG15_BIG_FIL_POST_REV_8_21_14_020_66_15]|nr:MAG: cytochrome c class I [Rhodospirillales bacterium CG15_BIG_FIL_POST_REV_8_21_14_020_66_15]
MAQDDPATPVERGRKVYNFRCYFCHGYNGDAATEAAEYLSPKPADFTTAKHLTAPKIMQVLRHGVKGTAMKSFAKTLSPEEIEDVARFIESEFVTKAAVNTFYHTKENGWPRHRERYAAAYPFVKREIAIDKAPTTMTPEQRHGLALFKKTCITCHAGRESKASGEAWSKYPLSDQGCGVVCHRDGRIDFPWRKDGARDSAGGAPATPYDVHNRAPVITGLSAQERRGEELYQANCAFCHAMDGSGGNWIGAFLDPPARNLNDPELRARLDHGSVIRVIRDGLSGTSMSAWKRVMTEDQIAAVAAYVEKAFFDRVPQQPGGVQR